ncbi:MAG TPA: hypothetical protein VKE95_10350 [Burkholderiales bacterium]|nr:hypothetical protein [Burkholderiales bacterium]
MRSERRRFLRMLGPAVLAFWTPGLAAIAEGGRDFSRPGERLLFYLQRQGLAWRRGK